LPNATANDGTDASQETEEAPVPQASPIPDKLPEPLSSAVPSSASCSAVEGQNIDNEWCIANCGNTPPNCPPNLCQCPDGLKGVTLPALPSASSLTTHSNESGTKRRLDLDKLTEGLDDSIAAKVLEKLEQTRRLKELRRKVKQLETNKVQAAVQAVQTTKKKTLRQQAPLLPEAEELPTVSKAAPKVASKAAASAVKAVSTSSKVGKAVPTKGAKESTVKVAPSTSAPGTASSKLAGSTKFTRASKKAASTSKVAKGGGDTGAAGVAAAEEVPSPWEAAIGAAREKQRQALAKAPPSKEPKKAPTIAGKEQSLAGLEPKHEQDGILFKAAFDAAPNKQRGTSQLASERKRVFAQELSQMRDEIAAYNRTRLEMQEMARDAAKQAQLEISKVSFLLLPSTTADPSTSVAPS